MSARRILRGASPFEWLALAIFAVAAAHSLFVLLGPFFKDLQLHGFHDWDSHSAYRYITVISIKKYHEFPFWHPYMSGGYPGWAYIEGAPNVISPYLPAYLLLPVQIAERVEIVGEISVAIVATYLFVGRYTSSVAIRGAIALVYALNGRVALQTSTGHTWHLEYAWFPLILYFFDKSVSSQKLRYAGYGGATMALMVYQGAIYPVPHAAVALGLMTVVIAIASRRLFPIYAYATLGITAVGLSAPKLFPLIDLVRRYPRKVDSNEAVNLGQLVTMFTDQAQSYSSPPLAMPQWGWHEYGMYIGVIPMVAMVAGLLLARGRNATALKIAGLVFLLLGMGAFHADSPWSFLHRFPPFSSQHVPSRFLQPALLLCLTAFAAALGPAFERLIRRFPIADVVLVCGAYWIGLNVATVGQQTTAHVFYMKAPEIHFADTFHQENLHRHDYTPGDWSGALLLSMFANEGCVKCYGIAETGTPGAIPEGTPQYRGEAYFASGKGSAKIVEWTTNRATVQFEGAAPGDVLVYNMNYDPSWRADGRPAIEHASAVATEVDAAQGVVKFTYYPRTFNAGLFLCFVTLLAFFIGTRPGGFEGVFGDVTRRLRRQPATAAP
jgi:hypothetical protein